MGQGGLVVYVTVVGYRLGGVRAGRWQVVGSRWARQAVWGCVRNAGVTVDGTMSWQMGTAQLPAPAISRRPLAPARPPPATPTAAHHPATPAGRRRLSPQRQRNGVYAATSGSPGSSHCGNVWWVSVQGRCEVCVTGAPVWGQISSAQAGLATQ